MLSAAPHAEVGEPWVATINLVLLISALIAATGFIGLYASHSPWRVSVVGRSMMLLASSVVLLILSGIFYNALGPDYPYRTAMRLGTWIFLNGALWFQLIVLIRVQNADYAATEKAKIELAQLPSGPDSGEMRKVNDNRAPV